MLQLRIFRCFMACGMMVIVFLNGGCVKATARYYMPLVAEQYPQKPDNILVPILEQPPKRPYTVIGKFAFDTKRDLSFLYKSLQYNARKNGADAVLMRSLTTSKREWMDYTPPRVDTERTLDWVTTCHNPVPTLQWVNKPVFRPGFSTPREESTRSVQAEMIIFKSLSSASN